ncbi:AI-2 transport protein TqsA [Parelusimicrobium proximum]|uniref:AI-2E family transporter n=1 Tax=Parelusimicrobium proximum TaxID=3228953 RepID=UPI003D16C5AB
MADNKDNKYDIISIYAKLNTACLMLLAAVAFTITLIYTKSILIPLVMAVLVHTVLAPIIRWQKQKLKIPRVLAIILTSLVFLLIVAVIVFFISNSVGAFISGAGVYQERFFSAVNWVTALFAKYGYNIQSSSIDEMIKGLPVFNLLKNTGSYVISLLTLIFVSTIMLIFLMAASTTEAKTESNMLKQIQNKISYYLIVKTVVSFVTGLVVWIILTSFKVELALIFGILTFLLNFIPNVGSIIAVLLPLPVMFLQFGFSPKFWVALSLTIIAQFTIGSIIEPKIIGDRVDMHPITVLASLIFWGLVWGIPGAFLSVPLTAAIQIILADIEPTKPIAELLAGRFPF